MFFHQGRLAAWTVLAVFLLTAGCAHKPIADPATASEPSTPAASSPSAGTETQTVIDWVDFLRLNGISYTHSWEVALTDPNKLGEAIGSVAFQVADHVTDTHYIIKDGDAAFLAAGTVVYALQDYPGREIVAVRDDQAIGGYKLYVADDERKNGLALTFEQTLQTKIARAALYPLDGAANKPLVELTNGSQVYLADLLRRAAQGPNAAIPRESAPSVYYRLLLDTGATIGYVDTVYRSGNHYYWNHPEPKELPDAFAYYVANERDVVFTIRGMSFVLPNHTDTVATGERIKRDGDTNNIKLVAADGKSERSLFAQAAVERLWEQARKNHPSDGEDKVYLYIADRAIPVRGGEWIAYATNKDTVVLGGNSGAFDVKLIRPDGTGDQTLVEGAAYGGVVQLLDSAGDRIVAEGGDRSLLDINGASGSVKRFPVGGMLDALSVDGRYVLYRKMAGDALVGTELAAFDLETETTIELGQAPPNYVFAQRAK
ncbi:MAG: hypothetical protein J7639_16240 [Paenibacillaceae bacterium]|nr:hypothetical protein [Paenibacillaceae bacterium]